MNRAASPDRQLGQRFNLGRRRQAVVSALAAEDTDVQFDHISINQTICDGQVCVKGTRMPVHQIVRMLANGDTAGDLLAEHPFLSREGMMACPDYAACFWGRAATTARIRRRQREPNWTPACCINMGERGHNLGTADHQR